MPSMVQFCLCSISVNNFLTWMFPSFNSFRNKHWNITVKILRWLSKDFSSFDLQKRIIVRRNTKFKTIWIWLCSTIIWGGCFKFNEKKYFSFQTILIKSYFFSRQAGNFKIKSKLIMVNLSWEFDLFKLLSIVMAQKHSF